MEETIVPWEDNWPVTSHWQTLSYTLYEQESTNRTDQHDITEILLKVALHNRKPKQTPNKNESDWWRNSDADNFFTIATYDRP